MADEVTVSDTLEVDEDGTWHYLHVPTEVRAGWAEHARRGSIRVTATLGASTWDGSLLPWADGSAQLSVNAAIRAREHVAAGDRITVTLRLRD